MAAAAMLQGDTAHNSQNKSLEGCAAAAGGITAAAELQGERQHTQQSKQKKIKLRLHTPGMQTQIKTTQNSTPVTAGARKCSQRI